MSGNNESAGKRKTTTTRNGNTQLCSVLGGVGVGGLAHPDPSGRVFRRLHHRFGKAGGKKAAVAVAHTILVIVWHVLQDEIVYTDLGADFYIDRNDPVMQKARVVRQLKELGYYVEISPAA